MPDLREMLRKTVEICAGRSLQFASLEPPHGARRWRPGLKPMINVAAIRMQQFGVQFYQASLTASDIDKLVRFEVLSYGDTAQPPVRVSSSGSAPQFPKSTGICSNGGLPRVRRPTSDKSFAGRSMSSSSTTNNAGRPETCLQSRAQSSFRATRS